MLDNWKKDNLLKKQLGLRHKQRIDSGEYKDCFKCGECKPVDYFEDNPNAQRPSQLGKNYLCRQCVNNREDELRG